MPVFPVETPVIANGMPVRLALLNSEWHGLGVFMCLSNSAAVIAIGLLIRPVIATTAPGSGQIYLFARITEGLLLAISVLAVQGSTLGLAVSGDTFYQLGMIALGLGSLPMCLWLIRSNFIPTILGALGFAGYICLIAAMIASTSGFETASMALLLLLTLHLKDWMRLPLDEISKAMTVRRHQDMAGSPSAANHVLRSFRAIYNHARRTGDLPECPTMAIEWFEGKPDGRIIEDLKHWRKTIDDLPNPIHRVFYELLLFNPHMHRRTFATVAMEAGVLEEIVGRLLNHTPLSITGQRYSRPSLDALRPSMEIACAEILKRISN